MQVSLPGGCRIPDSVQVSWAGHRSPGWPQTCLDPPSAHPQGTYGAQQCWAPPSPVTSRTVTVAGRTWAPRRMDGCEAGPAWPRGARGLIQTTPWVLTWVSGRAPLHWAMGAPESGCQNTHLCRVQGTEQTHGGAGVVLAQLRCHTMRLQPLLFFLPSQVGSWQPHPPQQRPRPRPGSGHLRCGKQLPHVRSEPGITSQGAVRAPKVGTGSISYWAVRMGGSGEGWGHVPLW